VTGLWIEEGWNPLHIFDMNPTFCLLEMVKQLDITH